MFVIPNTTILITNYDPSQSWEYDAENTSGYLFVSGESVFVRLTAGKFGQGKVYPEFMVSPGILTIGSETNPVTKVEVRGLNPGLTGAQVWGVLATAEDPVQGFTPVNFSVTQGGFVHPITLTAVIIQHNGVQVDVQPAIDFVDNAWNTWGVIDDGANNRVLISTKPNGGVSGTTTTTTITATNEAGATNIVSAGPITVDGATPLEVRAYAPRVAWQPNVLGDVGTICLFDGAVSLGLLGRFTTEDAAPASLQGTPWHGIAILDGPFLPAAGAHTYSIRGFKSAAADVFELDGGPAGAGNLFPVSLIVIPTTI